MLQRLLRLMGTSEAPWANHPSSGLKAVTETNIAVNSFKQLKRNRKNLGLTRIQTNDLCNNEM